MDVLLNQYNLYHRSHLTAISPLKITCRTAFSIIEILLSYDKINVSDAENYSMRS